MSLATRCTACGTIFRVVQDQLKVSEGWVRCGRCDDVFNAMEGLFDLDRDSPPEWSAAVGDADPSLPTGAEQPVLSGTSAEVVYEPLFSARHDPDPHRDHSPTAKPVDVRDRNEFADAQFNTDLLPDSATPEGDTVAVDPAIEPDTPTEAPAPDFVTRAERAFRWQQPRTRWGLSAAAVLLSAALGLQAMHHFRDAVAARWPQARPLVSTWCGWVDCRIELPRRVEDITVESTSLTHAITGSDAFKLSVTLRNRGSTPVALPSIDLSLTDAGGQLVARRALAPGDFRVASLGLDAGADATLQLMLSAGNRRVTGYTVEVFYP